MNLWRNAVKSSTSRLQQSVCVCVFAWLQKGFRKHCCGRFRSKTFQLLFLGKFPMFHVEHIITASYFWGVTLSLLTIQGKYWQMVISLADSMMFHVEHHGICDTAQRVRGTTQWFKEMNWLTSRGDSMFHVEHWVNQFGCSRVLKVDSALLRKSIGFRSFLDEDHPWVEP